MRRTILFAILCLCFVRHGIGQSCTATTFSFDLSASIDTTVSVQSVRNGDCCSGNNCLRFNLILNPACSYVNLTVANPAPNGSAFYQVNCGTPTSLATPVCIVGQTSVVITYCKPGNDAATYTITASGAIQGSADTTIREGCTGKMGVKGLMLATIGWTSIFPGASGAYNSFLSCTTGCDTINVTPQQGSPAYIDYQVSGNRLCGGTVYDTIRIYTAPQFNVAITPVYPEICPNGGSATLSAAATNGNAPYHYLWNTGDTTSTITVNGAGTYAVTVTDISGCAGVVQSVNVTPLPVPPAPTITTNAPLCTGSTLNLFASTVNGATYNWSGPNGFSSNQQNPVITNVTQNNSGVYSVTVTVNGCNSNIALTNVVVNAIPQPPTVSNNGPLCAGNNLQLNAANIANATYSWSGPSGFTSSQQNPSINNIGVSNEGIYSVIATVNGCSSAAASTNVIINALPLNPTVSSNSPICAGTTISLNANSDPGSGYSWTGPNGFSSASQNPVISNATVAANGNYMVTATLNGCSSGSTSINVVVNPIPNPPIAGTNGAVCSGTTIDLTASTIPNASYTWSGPNGFSSTLQNPVINNATAANAGTYLVTSTVNGCLSNAASTNVIVNATPQAPVVASNSSACEGSSFVLGAADIAGAIFNWSGPNGYSSNQQFNTINNATTAYNGVYTVTATVNGCTSPGSAVNVLVTPLPASPVLSTNSPVCEGSSVSLNASAINGASYVWSGPNGFNSTQQNPSLSSANMIHAGVYSCQSIVSGCYSPVSTTTLSIKPLPNPPAVNNNGPLCEGASLNLFAVSIPGATYNWTGPQGYISAGQNPSISNVKSANSGQYVVTATVNGCTSAPANSVVTIYSKPQVNAGADQVVIENYSTKFDAVANSAVKFTWTPAMYLNNDTILHPVCTPRSDMNYKLKITDVNGCTAEDELFVKLLKMPEVPNVFTPNNDGINDSWQIKWLADYSDCNVEIYSRYGQLIYHSTGYNKAWDGMVNGRPVPAATYYYIINLKHDLKPLSGFVDIVR